MRDAITPDRIANQIRMRRSAYSGTFLIVEGRSDKLLYERFINDTQCEFSIACSKDNAIDALDILEKDDFAGVLAIVDADFWVLEKSVPNKSNLFITDCHDVEMMLINSPALEKILRELGSEEKINNFGKNIRKTLVENCKIIGYLRWVSLKYCLNLKFEDLNFNKFIDQKTLVVDIDKLIKAVKDHSQKLALVDKQIKEWLNLLIDEKHDPFQVCCGHDLICILSIGLCKALGSCNYNEVKLEVLERELRLAYEHSYFCSTQLYVSIQNWEKNNQPYQVLKNFP